MFDRQCAIAPHHHHHHERAELDFCVKMNKGLLKVAEVGRGGPRQEAASLPPHHIFPLHLGLP